MKYQAIHTCVVTCKALLTNLMTKFGRSKNRPAKYLSEDEIVSDLVNNLSDEEALLLMEIPFDRLIGLHISVGMQIRNQYKLWDRRNPYVDVDDPMGPRFPDQVSQRIIEKVWRKVCTAEGVNHTNERS